MGFYPGQQLGRRYTIIRELGIGGIGITYLAKNQRGELRVIKTLREDRLNSPEWLRHQDKLKQDFRDEAWNLVKCDHPYIVKVERQFDEGNLPCMEMEYIDGEDLEKRVREKGALSEPEALLYIKQIGDALTLVHERGLLHRDLKPSNIMIRRDKKEAVLIDFGIARQFISGAVLKHTEICTHGYAPPEQYLPNAERGEYTDVYALAATLYTLLTGQLPLSATARLQNINLKPPQYFNPSISDRVNAAIMKGMELEYKIRPQLVTEWLSLLENNNIAGVSSTQSNTPSSIFTLLPPTVITPPRNWKCLHTIPNLSTKFAISPNEQILATGAGNNIKLLKLRTGELIRTWTGHWSFVSSIAFSPNGQILATGNVDETISEIADNTIKLWSVETGKELRTLTGHSNEVLSIAFSPDGQVLASGSADNTIQLWDVDTGKELCTLTGHVNSVAFRPDGKILVGGSWNGTIKLWGVETGKEFYTIMAHAHVVTSVAFSPNGQILASGSGDWTIKLWVAKTGKELRTLNHISYVSSIAFSPDGQILAGSSDKAIKLWDVGTGEELCTLIGHSFGVKSVAFSSDGQVLVSSDVYRNIKLWGRG